MRTLQVSDAAKDAGLWEAVAAGSIVLRYNAERVRELHREDSGVYKVLYGSQHVVFASGYLAPGNLLDVEIVRERGF